MSFQNILGHNQAIGRLQEYLKEERLVNGYLFCGPEGIGKKAVAMALAKAANCQARAPEPCAKCPSCLKIEKNQHPDVHLIDAEDSERIKIENIRQLQRQIGLRAYEARKKVFIIDNAHRLTPEAASALLKVLEEPPKDSLIILISAKPNLLFKTIISRCRTIKFYPMPRVELEAVLKDNYGLHLHLAHYLAYFCEGRLGKALRLKDTDVLREKNTVIDDFLFSHRPAIDNSLKIDADTLRRYLGILVSCFRDIYLAKAGLEHSQMINLDRKPELSRIIPRFSFTDLDKIMNFMSDSIFYLDHNINAKLLLSNLRTQIWRE